MTVIDLSTRVPLRVPTATATFAIGIAGYLGVNLSPYMITAAQTGLGIDVLGASWLVTATLLLTAVTGLVIAPLAPARSRVVTIAGFGLLLVFALWAASEDSLWAMAGVMGAEQAGLSPEGLGIALSGATAGGLLGSLLLMAVGSRLGRAVPLVLLLVAGGALKIVEGFTADATAFIVVFIAWNTIYAIAFMYFVATSAALDADGRWSGPLLAVYLVGSALTPVIGAAMVSVLGFQGFAIALGIASFVLAVPTGAIALLSTRLERATITESPA